jgi:hypothetical protein
MLTALSPEQRCGPNPRCHPTPVRKVAVPGIPDFAAELLRHDEPLTDEQEAACDLAIAESVAAIRSRYVEGR